MFSKLNVKTLVVIFVILLLIVAISQILKKSGDERNFMEKMVDVDTAKISAVTIIANGKTIPLKIKRNDTGWELIYNNKKYKADKNGVDAILNGLTMLKPDRLISTEKENWDEFDVSEKSGTSVEVEQNGKKIAAIVIGKPAFQQNNQNVTTYARLKDETDVYAINGFLAMNFNQDINSLRFKAFGSGRFDQITKVVFNYPADSSFTLSQTGNQWNVDGRKVDSTKVYNFLQMLANSTGTKFIDYNTPLLNPKYSLTANSNGKLLFELQAFPTDSLNMFVVTSTINPGANFIESIDLINNLFVSKDFFIKKLE